MPWPRFDIVSVLHRVFRSLPPEGWPLPVALQRIYVHLPRGSERYEVEPLSLHHYPKLCHVVRRLDASYWVRPVPDGIAPSSSPPAYVVPVSSPIAECCRQFFMAQSVASSSVSPEVLHSALRDAAQGMWYVPPSSYDLVGHAMKFLRYSVDRSCCYYVDWPALRQRVGLGVTTVDEAWLMREVPGYHRAWLEGHTVAEWLAAAPSTPQDGLTVFIRQRRRRSVAESAPSFLVFVDATLSPKAAQIRLRTLGVSPEMIYDVVHAQHPACPLILPEDHVHVAHATVERYLSQPPRKTIPQQLSGWSDILFLCPDDFVGEYVDRVALHVREVGLSHATTRIWVMSQSRVVRVPKIWPLADFQAFVTPLENPQYYQGVKEQ